MLTKIALQHLQHCSYTNLALIFNHTHTATHICPYTGIVIYRKKLVYKVPSNTNTVYGSNKGSISGIARQHTTDRS